MTLPLCLHLHSMVVALWWTYYKVWQLIDLNHTMNNIKGRKQSSFSSFFLWGGRGVIWSGVTLRFSFIVFSDYKCNPMHFWSHPKLCQTNMTDLLVQYCTSCTVLLFLYSTALLVQYCSSCTVLHFLYSTALLVQYCTSCTVLHFLYSTALLVQYCSCSSLIIWGVNAKWFYLLLDSIATRTLLLLTPHIDLLHTDLLYFCTSDTKRFMRFPTEHNVFCS